MIPCIPRPKGEPATGLRTPFGATENIATVPSPPALPAASRVPLGLKVTATVPEPDGKGDPGTAVKDPFGATV